MEVIGMTDEAKTDTRHYYFEKIKAQEIARGASEDEATRIASENVDRVMAKEQASHQD